MSISWRVECPPAGPKLTCRGTRACGAGMSKQVASKRKPTALGTKSAPNGSKVIGKANKTMAASSDEDDSEDEGVAKTQFDEEHAPEPARTKAAKGKTGNDEEPLTAREKRLQAKLDIVSRIRRECTFAQVAKLTAPHLHADQHRAGQDPEGFRATQPPADDRGRGVGEGSDEGGERALRESVARPAPHRSSADPESPS